MAAKVWKRKQLPKMDPNRVAHWSIKYRDFSEGVTLRPVQAKVVGYLIEESKNRAADTVYMLSQLGLSSTRLWRIFIPPVDPSYPFNGVLQKMNRTWHLICFIFEV